MKKASSPVIKDLVLIGGGYAHLAVLKNFAMQPVEGLRLTLVTREVEVPYSGMLPGYLAGHYDHDECHIDLGPLCRAAGARLYHASVEAIDPEQQLIKIQGRPSLAYDLCSINTGSTPSVATVSGVQEHALIAKPIDQFLDKWGHLCESIRQHQGAYRLVIVGAGAGGVELALSAQYGIQRLIESEQLTQVRLQCSIVTQGKEILASYTKAVRARFIRLLAARGVDVITATKVTSINDTHVSFEQGKTIAADKVIYVTHAQAPDWPKASGLAVDEQGFIRANRYLQSISHSNIFVAGDIAALPDKRPKSGVFAVRHGKVLARNLINAAHAQPLQKYRPQRNMLSIIGTGDDNAIAAYHGWTVQGHWLWRIKCKIDQDFIAKYNQIEHKPEIHADYNQQLANVQAHEELASLVMRCGGCGAKVGSSILQRVMQRLPTQQRQDILLGRDGDDSAIITVPQGKALVQSLDYFRAFIDDPYIFGAIASNHALGDVYAMGAEAHSVLALATVPYGREKIVEQSLYELLTGACRTLEPTGAALIGGHSAEGAELGFGLSVNGLVNPAKAMHKQGLKPGDMLILTKPVGTGTLFAADMRCRARGYWIDQALELMLLSNQPAVPVLHNFNVRACTDITGFGLVGHLYEMLKGSCCDAQIDLASLPVMVGARETAAQGILSSLQPQNLRLKRVIKNHSTASRQPDYALLFDPQTAGGLLFGVAAQNANDCVAALKLKGYRDASIIGRIVQSQDLEQAAAQVKQESISINV